MKKLITKEWKTRQSNVLNIFAFSFQYKNAINLKLQFTSKPMPTPIESVVFKAIIV